jgi:hypothetical protein
MAQYKTKTTRAQPKKKGAQPKDKAKSAEPQPKDKAKSAEPEAAKMATGELTVGGAIVAAGENAMSEAPPEPAETPAQAHHGAEEAPSGRAETAGEALPGPSQARQTSAETASEAHPGTQQQKQEQKQLRSHTYVHSGSGNEIQVLEVAQKGRPVLTKLFEKPKPTSIKGKGRGGGLNKKVEITTASTGTHGVDRIWNMMNQIAKEYAEQRVTDHSGIKQLKADYLQKIHNDADDEDEEDETPGAQNVVPPGQVSTSTAAGAVHPVRAEASGDPPSGLAETDGRASNARAKIPGEAHQGPAEPAGQAPSASAKRAGKAPSGRAETDVQAHPGRAEIAAEILKIAGEALPGVAKLAGRVHHARAEDNVAVASLLVAEAPEVPPKRKWKLRPLLHDGPEIATCEKCGGVDGMSSTAKICVSCAHHRVSPGSPSFGDQVAETPNRFERDIPVSASATRSGTACVDLEDEDID